MEVSLYIVSAYVSSYVCMYVRMHIHMYICRYMCAISTSQKRLTGYGCSSTAHVFMVC